MKKHFLLIFTALLLGFSLAESFAEILPKSVPDQIVNKKLEPVYFTNLPKPSAPAFYTWSIQKPGSLPPGLTLNQVGVLSGVPIKEGSFTFKVVCKNGTLPPVLSDSITINVTRALKPAVDTSLPITSASSGLLNLPDGQMDVPYIAAKGGYNFKATGGIPFLATRDKPTGYNWSLSWGKIPTGMTFNTVGALSGIPRLDPKLSGNFTQPQTFTFNITAIDAVLGNNTKTFTLKINPPEKPEILTDCPLSDGYHGALYPIVFLKAIKGKKEYSWSVAPRTPAPSLGANEFNRFPNGLKLSKAGAISGMPTVPGKFFFHLTVTDANGLSVEKDCSITIIPAPSISDTEFPTCWTANKSIDQFCLTAKDGRPGYTWAIVGQSLPQDLVIDKNTGCITGFCKQSGNFSVIVKVTDKNGVSTQKAFSFRVYEELKITSDCPLVFGTNGTAYITTLTATGGKLGCTWSLLPPSTLPPDLVLDPITGQITGTPRAVGNFSFSYKVSDACGNFATKNCYIVIDEPPTPPPADCPGRVTVVQICNSNSARDDNFDVVLNGTKIGDVDLGHDAKVGSLFIAHPTALVSSGDFTCPISAMVVHRFDPTRAYLGANSLNMNNIRNNASGNYGIVEIRSYRLTGSFLDDPQVISNLTYGGGSGESFSFNFTYSCPSETPVPLRMTLQGVQTCLVDPNFYLQSVSAKDLLAEDHLVAVPFIIGKTEVTNEEYSVFLNAVAKKSDTRGLYNSAMGTSPNGGIFRSGKAGAYSYAVKSGMGNYPVVYVSWFDAARYVNWLSNDSPSGLQDKTTTEDGAYALNGAVAGVSFVRNAINPNTKLKPTKWLLNESEWFTSAYLKSSDSPSVSFWSYPTQSDTPPDLKLANTKNLANYGNIFDGPTEAGFFSDSPSAFGTFDQGGNVREWTESMDSTKYRIIRGGSWSDSADAMKASESDVSDPTLEDDKTGFRIGGAP